MSDSMYEEDYLLRLIKQIVATAAHLVGGHAIAQIVQLNRSGDHQRALDEIDGAWDDLLDGPRGVARAVDTQTLVGMLRDPVRTRLAAQLCAEEARAWTGLGDAARAADRYRRAIELVLEARAIDPQRSAEQEVQDVAALRELTSSAPEAALAPRYRARLDKVLGSDRDREPHT
jgi:tetratricopeptide (TPR) repeat protein